MNEQQRDRRVIVFSTLVGIVGVCVVLWFLTNFVLKVMNVDFEDKVDYYIRLITDMDNNVEIPENAEFVVENGEIAFFETNCSRIEVKASYETLTSEKQTISLKKLVDQNVYEITFSPVYSLFLKTPIQCTLDVKGYDEDGEQVIEQNYYFSGKKGKSK